MEYAHPARLEQRPGRGRDGESRIRTYDPRRRTVLSRTYSVDDVSVPVSGGGVVGFDAPEFHDCPTRSRPDGTDDDCALTYAPPVDRTPGAPTPRPSD